MDVARRQRGGGALKGDVVNGGWGLGVGGLGVGWTVEWKLNRGKKNKWIPTGGGATLLTLSCVRSGLCAGLSHCLRDNPVMGTHGLLLL